MKARAPIPPRHGRVSVSLRAAGALILAGLSVVSAPAAGAAQQEPDGTGPIEATYAEAGPWGVKTVVTEEFTIVHPTPLGSHDGNPDDGGYHHPIVTFGVGTWGLPHMYQDSLAHWASWGHVVISPNISHTGSGVEMWDGVQHLFAENDDPQSIFYDRLDTSRVAAGGHSQGAEGALWTNHWAEGELTTVFTLSLPDPFFWRAIWTDEEWETLIIGLTELLDLPPAPDFSFLPDLDRQDLLNDVDAPLFFLRPSEDKVIIEGIIEFPIGTEAGHTEFVDQAAGPAFKTTVVGEGHSFDMLPEVSSAGLVAAWLDYQLLDDPLACRAFREADGEPPELHGNPLLENFGQKGLAECGPLEEPMEPDAWCVAPCSLEQVVEFDVVGDGLAMSQEGSSVGLESVVLDGEPRSAGGSLAEVTVTDRRGGGAGWSLTGQVDDLGAVPGVGSCPAGDPSMWEFGCIPGDNLGWGPDAVVAHDAVPGDVATVEPGAELAGGLGSQAQSLCSASATGSGGSFRCGASLGLRVPASTDAGTYTATLTLTLA